MRSLAGILAVLPLATVLTACGDDGPEHAADRPPVFAYDSDLEAPKRSAYPGNEEAPEPDDGRIDLTLDTGAEVVLWIDPDDIRRVLVQHSDPGDSSAWTAPEQLYEAGDGCLFINADTDGSTVAATFGCYATDAWIQQAPDQGQAAVTTDLASWDVEDFGELFGKPEVDGDVVTWTESDVRWSADGGFGRG